MGFLQRLMAVRAVVVQLTPQLSNVASPHFKSASVTSPPNLPTRRPSAS
jgi:hypothetical protein